jgi:Peptidase family C25
MRMGRSYVSDGYFTNDGTASNFPIMNSTGCYAASFDNRGAGGSYGVADCIGEQMVTINNCAVAFIGNSRYGWFTEGTTNGPSNHFQREFYDAVFTEGVTTLGAANERSKDETVSFLDLPDEWEPGAVRWCFYTLNLLGDPALDGWTDTPESLASVHPAYLARGDTLYEIETEAPGATGCLYRDGICYARGAADETGHIDLVVYRAIADSVAWLELSVKAHDHYLDRDTIFITEPTEVAGLPPAIRLDQNFPNPFNPATTIQFSLARDCDVDLRAYDTAGREVARLARGRMSKGLHTVRWAPSNVASGMYFYVLTAEGTAITRKAVLLR